MPGRDLVGSGKLHQGKASDGAECLDTNKDEGNGGSMIKQRCVIGDYVWQDWQLVRATGVMKYNNGKGGSWCLAVDPASSANRVHLVLCTGADLAWEYDDATKRLKHKALGLCLDAANTAAVAVAPCNLNAPSQDWSWE